MPLKRLHFLLGLLTLLLGVVGYFYFFPGQTSLFNHEAAVIESHLPPVTESLPARYVSLIDVITTSLDRIKEVATASSTEKEERVAQTATSSVETAEPAPKDLADAIVNIFCTYSTPEYRRTVSGTGFFISAKGAILTNAHVAEYLLLADEPGQRDVSCEVRTGQEASATYSAELLYISPSFVLQHAKDIDSTEQRGNGENDFALIYITGALDGASIPAQFSYLPPSTNPLGADMRNRTVIVVGYPSLAGTDINMQTRAIATTTITEIYTFKSGLADVFSMSESNLGHQGSSGGPVIDSFGRAIGVISTKDVDSTALNAITVAYIDRSMKDETGYDLISTLSGDLSLRAKLFNETVAPILKELLSEAMKK